MKKIIMWSTLFFLMCRVVLSAATDAKGLRYSPEDRYHAEITLDIVSTGEKHMQAAWSIRVNLACENAKDADVIIVRTTDVIVKGKKDGEVIQEAQIEQMSAYFADLEIRFPVEPDGTIKMDSLSGDQADEYEIALMSCLSPELPSREIQKGDTWIVGANEKSGNQSSISELSTGVRPIRGRYVQDVPLKSLRFGARNPDVPIAKLQYGAVNLSDCRVQVAYWNKKSGKILKSCLYRVTEVEVGGRKVRATKKYRIKKVK